MLSQYDRRQLELISSRLHLEDPEFARSFREWKPRPEPTTRRWPFTVLMVLAGLILLAGVLVGAFSFVFLGALSGAGVVFAYRRHALRTSRPATAPRVPSKVRRRHRRR